MENARLAVSQGPGKTIFMILLLIVFVGLIYWLYSYLNNGGDLKDFVVYTSATEGLAMNPTKAPVPYTAANVPGLYSGGEFSVSTWIYVTNWASSTFNKPFLTLDGGGGQYKTLVLYLGQNTNKLGVRVSHALPSGPATDASQVTLALIKGTGSSSPSTPYTDSDLKSCDIEQVNLQKWVNITVVLSGTTVDVYIDGKLSRSCILQGIYKVDGQNQTLTLGNTLGGTYGGVIGTTRAANFAYSPDVVYRNYLNGPFDRSILSLLWNYINPASYSVSIQKTS
jgi:hypothetical protein